MLYDLWEIFLFWTTYLVRFNMVLTGILYTSLGIFIFNDLIFIPGKYNKVEQIPMTLCDFLRNKRNQLKLTQQHLAEKAGVALGFVRNLEQGKTTLRMDKVNQVLKLFGQ